MSPIHGGSLCSFVLALVLAGPITAPVQDKSEPASPPVTPPPAEVVPPAEDVSVDPAKRSAENNPLGDEITPELGGEVADRVEAHLRQIGELA